MTNIHMINELNNNSIFPINGKYQKNCLPDSIIDTKTDIGRISGLYRTDDNYRPYTIYGNSGKFFTIDFHITTSRDFTFTWFQIGMMAWNSFMVLLKVEVMFKSDFMIMPQHKELLQKLFFYSLPFALSLKRNRNYKHAFLHLIYANLWCHSVSIIKLFFIISSKEKNYIA